MAAAVGAQVAAAAPPPPAQRIFVTVHNRQYELVFYQTNLANGTREEIKGVHLTQQEIAQAHQFAAQMIPQLSQYLAAQEAQLSQQNRQLPRIKWIDQNGIEFEAAQGAPQGPPSPFPAQNAQIGGQVGALWAQFSNQVMNTFQNQIQAAANAMAAAVASAGAPAQQPPQPAAVAPPAIGGSPVISPIFGTGNRAALTKTYKDCRAIELSLLLQDPAKTDANASLAPNFLLSTRAKKREANRSHDKKDLLTAPRVLQKNIETEIAALLGSKNLKELIKKYEADIQKEDVLHPRTIRHNVEQAIETVYDSFVNSRLIIPTSTPLECQDNFEKALQEIENATQQQHIHKYYNAMAEARGIQLRFANFQELKKALEESYQKALSDPRKEQAHYEELRDCLIEALASWSDQDGNDLATLPRPAAQAPPPVAVAPVGRWGRTKQNISQAAQAGKLALNAAKPYGNRFARWMSGH